MAHEVETLAWTGEEPWHGLGKRVPGNLAPSEILHEADLDWDVNKFPVYADVNGKRLSTGKQALVRSKDDSILDIVSDDWNPVQNYEALDFFTKWVAAGDMTMEVAGSLMNGKLVFATARIKDSFEVVAGDTVESFLLFSNPHMYGRSIDVRTTQVRTVCKNTLNMALSGSSKRMVKVNHRRVFDANEVKMALGFAHENMNIYKEKAQFLVSKTIDDNIVKDYLSTLFPATDRQASNDNMSLRARVVRGALETQPGAEFGEGTFWQLFNAVTACVDHQFGRNNDTRMNSAWFGAGAELKVKALDLALKMAA